MVPTEETEGLFSATAKQMRDMIMKSHGSTDPISGKVNCPNGAKECWRSQNCEGGESYCWKPAYVLNKLVLSSIAGRLPLDTPELSDGVSDEAPKIVPKQWRQHSTYQNSKAAWSGNLDGSTMFGDTETGGVPTGADGVRDGVICEKKWNGIMEQYGDAFPLWSAPFGNENQTVDRMHKDFDTFMGRQDCLSDPLCRMQYYETCKKVILGLTLSTANKRYFASGTEVSRRVQVRKCGVP